MDNFEQMFVYLKQLLDTIEHKADFSFAGYKIATKAKLDDVLCCFQAALPKAFKQGLLFNRDGKYPSICAYNELVLTIHKKMPFCSGMYIISLRDAQKLVNVIRQHIKRDTEQLAMQHD